jgi:hypothetical protein
MKRCYRESEERSGEKMAGKRERQRIPLVTCQRALGKPRESLEVGENIKK